MEERERTGVLEVRLVDLHEPQKSRQKNEIASLIMARHHPELNVPPRNRTANSYRVEALIGELSILDPAESTLNRPFEFVRRSA